VGDTFTGFQKSLSKKSEYFFSELEVTLTDTNLKAATISGIIDKKLVSISGKKLSQRVYFEGEIIDGERHTFTSNLSAKCEALDVYFWSRFPSFKDITSLKDLKGDHSSKYVYMRWMERGTLKTKLAKRQNAKKVDANSS
jgi:Vacuolar import and degradation protein